MFSVIQRIRKRLLTRYSQVIVLRVNISSDTVRAQSTNHFCAQNPIGPRSHAENFVVLCFFLPKRKRYDYDSYLVCSKPHLLSAFDRECSTNVFPNTNAFAEHIEHVPL